MKAGIGDVFRPRGAPPPSAARPEPKGASRGNGGTSMRPAGRRGCPVATTDRSRRLGKRGAGGSARRMRMPAPRRRGRQRTPTSRRRVTPGIQASAVCRRRGRTPGRTSQCNVLPQRSPRRRSQGHTADLATTRIKSSARRRQHYVFDRALLLRFLASEHSYPEVDQDDGGSATGIPV